MWDALTLETGAKAAVYLAALAYLGAVTAAAVARPRLGGGVILVAAAGVARAAGAAGLAALILRAVFHTMGVGDGGFDTETFAIVVLESRWGGRWQWQAAAAAAATAVALTRGLSRGAWGGAAAAAAAWCAATPLLGHGASSLWQHATHAAHLAVTGSWLGTVAVLAGVAGRVPPADLGVVIARFSPWALVCATTAGASGAVLALTYLGPLGDGLASPYGRWLIVKLTLVGAAAACGFVNWRRTARGSPPAPGVLRLEALAAALAAIVTAVLTETAHP